jgi:hypothetical protein
MSGDGTSVTMYMLIWCEGLPGGAWILGGFMHRTSHLYKVEAPREDLLEVLVVSGRQRHIDGGALGLQVVVGFAVERAVGGDLASDVDAGRHGRGLVELHAGHRHHILTF